MSKKKDYDPMDHAIKFEDESLTHQSFKDQCDITNIMRRYEQTGIAQHITSAVAQYGDFTDIPDYQTALNIVMEAEEAFMQLPATMRFRFDNDPGKFLEFIDDPANRDEMIELGMINPPKEDLSFNSTAPAPEATVAPGST